MYFFFLLYSIFFLFIILVDDLNCFFFVAVANLKKKMDAV